ncbi:MAG: anti-sigma factor [Chloroflexi bacterium]|nr:anti-sigma factor [Chloroflexota bacterium]
MNCRQVQDLIPVYALGAVEIQERDALESHVQGCPHCAAALRQYLEAAAALAQATPSVEPPARLRAAILQRVAELPQETPILDLPHQLAYPGTRAGRGWTPPGWAVSIAAVFSLTLAAALLTSVLDLRRQLGQLREDNQRMSDMVARQQQDNKQIVEMVSQQRELTYAIAIPGMETMVLKSTETAAKARGMMMVSSDYTWAVLVSQGLEPRDSMGYQLWLIRDGQRVSGGVFTVDNTGYGLMRVKFPSPLSEFSAIGITLEPLQGSPGPTGKQVFSATVH